MPFDDEPSALLGCLMILGLMLLRAIVVACVTSPVWGTALLVSHLTYPSPLPSAPVPYDKLTAGTCLRGKDIAYNAGTPFPRMVPTEPCGRPHDAEVFYVNLRAWPRAGARPTGNAARARCVQQFAAYDGVPYGRQSYYTILEVEPNVVTWGAGDREVVCVAYHVTGDRPDGASLQGSMRGDHGGPSDNGDNGPLFVVAPDSEQ
jgi:hypothetical protein